MGIQIRSIVAQLLQEYQDTRRRLFLDAADEIVRLQSIVDMSRIDEAIPLITSINTIIKTAGEVYRVGPTAIKSPSRLPKYVEARMSAVLACRRLTRATYTTLGKQFNRRHAAIIYLERRAEEKEKADAQYSDVVDLICRKALETTRKNPMETTVW